MSPRQVLCLHVKCCVSTSSVVSPRQVLCLHVKCWKVIFVQVYVSKCCQEWLTWLTGDSSLKLLRLLKIRSLLPGTALFTQGYLACICFRLSSQLMTLGVQLREVVLSTLSRQFSEGLKFVFRVETWQLFLVSDLIR